VTRIGNQKASRLTEFRIGLEKCSDASVFYHTFQSLGRHHSLTKGFSSDFAQWILASCNRAELAERLASLDVRDYVSLVDLRIELLRVVGNYCQLYPRRAEQPAFEPFFFCERVEVITPLGMEARTLQEFRQALEQLSNASFNFHFIVSRLRLQLRTNDFSNWFATGLGLETLAQRANRIDILTSTLDGVRASFFALVDQAVEP
jgi:hypothetical protein